MSGYELVNVSDGLSPFDGPRGPGSPASPGSGRRHEPSIKVKVMGSLMCFCCLIFLYLGAEIAAWARQASCNFELGDLDVTWNTVIPSKTMTQMDVGIFTVFWLQVDVYDENSTSAPMIGSWSNLDLLFGMVEKYAYVQANGPTVLEAWQPWGIYFGQRYHVWTCSSLRREYYIEEDWWARPWFSFNSQQIFNIREMPSGRLVAKSQHRKNDAWSWNAHWTATVESLAGEAIATLRQEASNPLWFFGNFQKWWVDNERPDLLPNEVVSFLAAVYDIDKAKENKRKSKR